MRTSALWGKDFALELVVKLLSLICQHEEARNITGSDNFRCCAFVCLETGREGERLFGCVCVCVFFFPVSADGDTCADLQRKTSQSCFSYRRL